MIFSRRKIGGDAKNYPKIQSSDQGIEHLLFCSDLGPFDLKKMEVGNRRWEGFGGRGGKRNCI